MRNKNYILMLTTLVIAQVAAAQDFKNMIIIEQTGSNILEAMQTGELNKSDIYQQGDGNSVLSFQFGYENSTYIQQIGNENLFKLEQLGDENLAGANDNPFMQLGDGNKLGGVSKNDNLVFDESGYAHQFDGAVFDPNSCQSGDNNAIGLHQQSGDTGLIKQFGDCNTSLLWQSGGGQIATILQTGYENRASVFQK